MLKTIKGIIYKIREMSNFAFVILKTKRELLQCVYSVEYSKFALSELCENMSVIIEGEVVKDERSPNGVEVRLISFKCLSKPEHELPVVINKKEVTAQCH